MRWGHVWRNHYAQFSHIFLPGTTVSPLSSWFRALSMGKFPHLQMFLMSSKSADQTAAPNIFWSLMNLPCKSKQRHWPWIFCHTTSLSTLVQVCCGKKLRDFTSCWKARADLCNENTAITLHFVASKFLTLIFAPMSEQVMMVIFLWQVMVLFGRRYISRSDGRLKICTAKANRN